MASHTMAPPAPRDTQTTKQQDSIVLSSLEVCHQNQATSWWGFMGMEVQPLQQWQDLQGLLHESQGSHLA